MPIFEYQCPTCLCVKEVLRRKEILDDIELCPECYEESGLDVEMERIISKASFTFVGGSPTGSKGHD